LDKRPVLLPHDLISLIRNANCVMVLTGAGVSAESGIPTFRDPQTGLWAGYKPEDLASPQAFVKNPKRVWEWYTWRRKLIEVAAPNPGHYALAALQSRIPSLILATQNIDGLHQRAGSQNLIELHGNIFRARCLDENRVWPSWDETKGNPPHCPDCGGMLRPDVVWFGEALPELSLQQAYSAAQKCNMVMTIGTSGLVQPAASLPLIAQECGAVFVEINLQQTVLSKEADFCLQGLAGEVLPAILAVIDQTETSDQNTLV
jgi:NAD-dependent deacetylase